MTLLKQIPPVHYAIAVSSLGAVAGTTFSIMAILTMGDIAAGRNRQATSSILEPSGQWLHR